MLNRIRAALETFDLPVHYGKVPKQQGEYNFFVFNRARVKKSGTSNCDFNYYYRIGLVMENYIPEGFEIEVIKKIKEATGMRLADGDILFEYVFKDNTELVCEMAVIEFTKTVKGCNV